MRTKYVNRDYLEHRVNCINAELINSHHETAERQRLEAARNYYVGKLVELDESGLNLVDIESYEHNK